MGGVLCIWLVTSTQFIPSDQGGFLFILRLIGTNQCASSVFNRKLNDNINDTVDERSRHLSRLIFTNFCLAKHQYSIRMDSCLAIAPFVLLSVLILDWFTNLLYVSTKTANKSKVC